MGLVIFLCVTFSPEWDTNDDVGMSMVAHGYGIAAAGSPNLIFSNIVWGYFVRLLPNVGGILGYSLATMATLVAIGSVILYVMRAMGSNWLAATLVLLLVMIRPILFPQFTINAGLLATSAVLCWLLYEKRNAKLAFAFGCLLAYAGFLVRSQELLLVFLIAAPLLPWRKFFATRFAWTGLSCLLIAIAGSSYIDGKAYQAPEWQQFNAINPARAPFTDFGAGQALKSRPELLAKHGFSANDIDLIGHWFFVDPKISNSVVINDMLRDLGPMPSQRGAMQNGWAAIETLAHPVLMPLLLAAIFLLVALPSRSLALSWCLCLLAFFALGMLGRPGVLRVYIPVLSLLVLAPILIAYGGVGFRPVRRWIAYAALVSAASVNTTMVVAESQTAATVSAATTSSLRTFPTSPIVVWGAVFPYETVFKVLQEPNVARNYQLYAMGAFTLAPFSRAHAEELAGRGFVKQLLSEHGVQVIATESHRKLLDGYCQEHWQGSLIVMQTRQYGNLAASQFRCDRNAG